MGSPGNETNQARGLNPSTATASAAPFSHPTTQIPDHELVERIGRGSYGEVWLARNVMGTARAVKIVYRDRFDHQRPFDREFAGLKYYEPISRSNEGLVNILQIGRNEEADYFYYVMELADDAAGGEPAAAGYVACTLRREIQKHQRLPLERCIELAMNLAAALGHLHKHELVHRDLKPSNIIIVNGRAKIADIGLVAFSGDDSKSLVGTEGFFPPQGTGTPQSDLYSLGKVLYEAVTGLDRLHFPQWPADLLSDTGHERYMEFNEVLLKMCDTDPAARYQRAEDLLADLALLQAGRSLRSLRRMESRLRWARRFGLVMVALALVSLGAYGYAKRQTQRERDAREQVQRAEAAGKHQLAEARLAQARAIRRTHEAGQRFAAMEVIRQAAQQAPSLELRNEAIGALALIDLRVAQRLPRQGSSFSEPAVDFQITRYVCGDEEGNLTIRRTTDEAELLRLPGEGRRVDWLPGFSRDGRYLAVRPTRERLVIWDLTRATKALEVPEQADQVFCRFTSDSRAVVWSAGEEPLRRCDLASGAISEFLPVDKNVWRFDCSPDQRYTAIAYAETNYLIEVIEVETKRVVARIEHPAFVQGMEWHPSRALLATGCYDRNVYVWNPMTGTKQATLSGHQDVAPSLSFHPGGDLVASSSWDGTTRVWDIPSQRQLVVLQEGGDNLQFSEDGRWLSFGEFSDAHTLVCEVAAETVCANLRTRRAEGEEVVSALAFGMDERLLAGACLKGTQFFEARQRVSSGMQASGRVLSLWFEADGAHLMTAGNDGILKWPIIGIEPSKVRIGKPVQLAMPESDILFGCASRGLLAWTDGPQVRMKWSDGRQQVIATRAQMEHISVSHDARWVAASELEGSSVYVWETSTGAEWCRIPVRGRVRLVFSPGEDLVIGGAEEYIIWNVPAKKATHALPRFQTSSGFGKASFTTDGRLLALARTRSLVAVYRYPELQELASFEAAHGAGISALAFAPSGRTLAVASTMDEIQLWDIEALRRELRPVGLDWPD